MDKVESQIFNKEINKYVEKNIQFISHYKNNMAHNWAMQTKPEEKLDYIKNSDKMERVINVFVQIKFMKVLIFNLEDQ